MSYFGTPLYPASLPDQTSVVSIVGNTTLAAGASTYGKNYVITGAGGYTLTLPAIDGTNWPSKSFSIYNNSSALCTVNTVGSDTALLLGSSYSSMSILPGERFLVQNMVTSWVIALESASRTTTAPQFDNTIRTASTAFVKQAGMQSSGWMAYNVNTTLTAAHIGATVVGYGTVAFSFSLPTAGTVPIGSRIEFLNTCTQPVNVFRAGSDNIINNQTNLTVIQLGTGDTMTLENTSGNWYVVGGSMSLQGAGMFGSLLAKPGYQKLPSGLIFQWGSIGTIAANSSLVVSYTISFPTATLATIVTAGATAVTSPTICGISGAGGGNALANFQAWNSSSSVATQPGNYVAIGY